MTAAPIVCCTCSRSGGWAGSFIGREQDVAEFRSLLLTTRLLTLTGPGGIGKTRLALEVARGCADAAFVDLAPVPDAWLVATAVAAAFGIREQPRVSFLDLLATSLSSRALLLVLDNCEHLLTACSQLADILLRRCPRVRILATSRQPLAVEGEQVVPVTAMSVGRSTDPDSAGSSDAVRLFAERARLVQRDFAVDDRNVATVAEVCRRLDGIPLGIELEAASLRVLGPQGLAARLDEHLPVLSAATHGAPLRHRTLRAAVDWSYDLLKEQEQTFFRRLSIFAGGWTLEAAEGVCAGEALESADVLDLLARLVDRSMVIMHQQAEAPRFGPLETLREYAAERIVDSGEHELLRERHRAWCVRLATQGARGFGRPDQLMWVRRLKSEQDNIRAALRWTLMGAHDPEPGLRIAASMVRFWDTQGDLREGTDWLTALLALPNARRQAVTHAQALAALGYLAVVRGDQPQAMALLNESLAFWRAIGEPRGQAIATFFLGVAVGWSAPDLPRTVAVFEESLALARRHGPRWVEYFSLQALGEAARLSHVHDRAATLLSESLALAREAGDRWGGFHALFVLALLAMQQGALERAYAYAHEALAMTIELGDTRGTTYVLETLACIASTDGHLVEATRLFGAAQALREPIGDFMSATLHADRERGVARARAGLGRSNPSSSLGRWPRHVDGRGRSGS